jgi:hypothetical protein
MGIYLARHLIEQHFVGTALHELVLEPHEGGALWRRLTGGEPGVAPERSAIL